MKEIVELMINGDDIYYFNLQKENFIKSFRYQNFEDALASLEQQKFDLEYNVKKINEAIEIMKVINYENKRIKSKMKYPKKNLRR